MAWVSGGARREPAFNCVEARASLCVNGPLVRSMKFLLSGLAMGAHGVSLNGGTVCTCTKLET
eukprot:COSAG02_NODE_2254_length_9348_cov_2.773273_10_plen_63_part_00